MILRQNNGKDYIKLLNKIIKKGNEVELTKELTNQTLELNMASREALSKIFDVDVVLLKEFEQYINGNSKEPFYNIERLWVYKERLDEFNNYILKRITEGQTSTSRQFSIEFDRLHCFQNVQGLFRDGEVIIIATMRSCNAMVNLPFDAMVAFMFGEVLKKALRLEEKTNINIVMQIGSLHIFESN